MADTQQVATVDNKVMAQRAKEALETIGIKTGFFYGKGGVTGLKLSVAECVELVHKLGMDITE